MKTFRVFMSNHNAVEEREFCFEVNNGASDATIASAFMGSYDKVKEKCCCNKYEKNSIKIACALAHCKVDLDIDYKIQPFKYCTYCGKKLTN